MVLLPLANGAVEYRYDDTRPESRIARLVVDDVFLRANILRGAGWQVLAPDIGIILAWMVVSFLLAVRIFRCR
jgi:hypothetical protein